MSINLVTISFIWIRKSKANRDINSAWRFGNPLTAMEQSPIVSTLKTLYFLADLSIAVYISSSKQKTCTGFRVADQCVKPAISAKKTVHSGYLPQRGTTLTTNTICTIINLGWFFWNSTIVVALVVLGSHESVTVRFWKKRWDYRTGRLVSAPVVVFFEGNDHTPWTMTTSREI